jgi:N-acetylneuraminic acid mutarotase
MPGQQWGHGLAWTGSRVILYQIDGSIWSYDPRTNAWTALVAAGATGSPPVRMFITLAVIGTKVYLFGGGQNDLWAYDTVANKWTLLIASGAVGSPPDRAQYGLVSDGTKLILFSGNSYTSDLWWYDPLTNAWTQKIADGAPGSPAGRRGPYFVWAGSRAILFGGNIATGPLNDVWWYDPTTNAWTAKIVNGAAGSPSARTVGSMAWTGTAAIVFGGIGGTYPNDTWSYDPTVNAWTLKIAAGAPGSPAGREADALVWDGSEVVLFGGGLLSGVFFDDVWWYTP